MKKHFCTLCLCLLLSVPAAVYAEETAVSAAGETTVVTTTNSDNTAVSKKASPFGGSIELFTGVFYSDMIEYVFEKGRKDELSRLEWEEHFVPYLNLRGEFDFWNFFTCVSLITSIPVRSGYMRDYDYMLSDTGRPSHFSQHDAMFDKHLEIYPEIGWGIDIWRFYFGASAGFLYRNRKWSATGGYTQYPKQGEYWSDDLPKQEQAGTVITYEESLWAPVLSLYIDFSINERFTIGNTTSWYPYINVKTIDTHILRQTRFHDEMLGGWGILTETNVTYRPKTSDIVNFKLGFGYEGLFPNRGTSASGGLGMDTYLGYDSEIESQLESYLFWLHLGVIIYPAKLFTIK